MRLILCLCASLVTAAAFAGAAPHYQLARTYTLGGTDGWDYLSFDAAGRRLFVTRGTHVQVVDVDKGSVLGDIPDTRGVHGVALAPDLGLGFSSDGKADAVTEFDLKTLKVLATIKIPGDRPDAIAYEPVTHRVFTFDGGSNDSTVIDARSGKVIGTVPLAGRPEAAVADGKGHVYVNIESTSQLSALDAATAKVTATWSLAPCAGPSAIAMDAAHRRLFSGCDNKLMVVSDADAGKVVASAPIGEGVDAGDFDPATGLVFMSCGEGVLSVIHEDAPDRYTPAQTAPTQRFARTMALDHRTHEVYLVRAEVKITPVPDGSRPKREVLPGTFAVLVMRSGNAK